MLATCLLAMSTAAAGTARATVELGPEGARVVRVRADAGAPAAPVKGPSTAVVEIVDAVGTVLATAPVPDARLRTVVLPDGTGTGAWLDRGLVVVDIPWPEGAVSVRTALGSRKPTPAPPAGTAIPVLQSGDAGDRLDLVFLGDGYAEDELDDFAEDVDWIVDYLLDIPPYGVYSDLFNIWRIDRPSAESGVDHPVAGDLRDTVFDCAYDCTGFDRLVCCDEATVLDVVDAEVPGADGILVLVNDTDYGGSGGLTYAVSYVGLAEGRQVAAHELGHTLLGLWDEYEVGVDGDTEGPNCSLDPLGHWDDWRGEGAVDAYPGCFFGNAFRPTDAGCMMKTLREGYCPICREHAVREMYRRLPEIVGSVDPEPGTAIQADDDEPVPITIETQVPDVHLTFEWSLDGDVVYPDRRELDLRCSGLQGELTLRIHDDTKWVRHDPEGLLEQSVGPWQVDAPTCRNGEAVRGCACGSETGAPGFAAALILLALRRRR